MMWSPDENDAYRGAPHEPDPDESDLLAKLRWLGKRHAVVGEQRNYLEEAADEIEKLRDRVVGAVAINAVSRDQYPLPPVYGVYCCAENVNALTLVFRRRPTDNDMRNLHDLVRAFEGPNVAISGGR